MQSLSAIILASGAALLGASLALAVSQAPLGSPLFYGVVGVMGLAYVATLRRVWHEPAASPRWLYIAFVIAVAIRVPLAVPKVGHDNDMVRYVWDGRVQTLGYNPYAVTPADPAMARTHNDETREMPSRRARTPYPPGAQLFFRLVVGLHDSSRAMKFALVFCDLMTMVVLWRWLAVTGRNEWLTLAYAWNPLVVLEVAHSGHIDALGALWITASAYWLARKRTSLASVAFVLAVTTKLLPIVLLPLYLGRVKLRDLLVGGALFALLYIPFMTGGTMPLGAVPNVVAFIRFNGPLFRIIAQLGTPQVAAAFAVGAGFLVAVWARWQWRADEPAAWAWPMAVALAGAPVIYPWYLLYFTPFLFSSLTAPLIVWTFTIFPVYLVWYVPALRRPWVVPTTVLLFEYGAFVLSLAWLVWWRRSRPED
ncbi:MAG TPA: hypothetical protein VF147_17355 [Vicinamibacterales bacterium]